MGIVRTSQIKSLGRGTIALTAANLTADATITAVDTSKTLIFNLGMATAADSISKTSAYLSLVNSTTIRATRGNQDGSVSSTISYQYVEYY